MVADERTAWGAGISHPGSQDLGTDGSFATGSKSAILPPIVRLKSPDPVERCGQIGDAQHPILAISRASDSEDGCIAPARWLSSQKAPLCNPCPHSLASKAGAEGFKPPYGGIKIRPAPQRKQYTF